MVDLLLGYFTSKIFKFFLSKHHHLCWVPLMTWCLWRFNIAHWIVLGKWLLLNRTLALIKNEACWLIVLKYLWNIGSLLVHLNLWLLILWSGFLNINCKRSNKPSSITIIRHSNYSSSLPTCIIKVNFSYNIWGLWFRCAWVAYCIVQLKVFFCLISYTKGMPINYWQIILSYIRRSYLHLSSSIVLPTTKMLIQIVYCWSALIINCNRILCYIECTTQLTLIWFCFWERLQHWIVIFTLTLWLWYLWFWCLWLRSLWSSWIRIDKSSWSSSSLSFNKEVIMSYYHRFFYEVVFFSYSIYDTSFSWSTFRMTWTH